MTERILKPVGKVQSPTISPRTIDFDLRFKHTVTTNKKEDRIWYAMDTCINKHDLACAVRTDGESRDCGRP